MKPKNHKSRMKKGKKGKWKYVTTTAPQAGLWPFEGHEHRLAGEMQYYYGDERPTKEESVAQCRYKGRLAAANKLPIQLDAQ